MTTKDQHERRGDLIRAPIRTRLGNVVMRWVRPDNPNIVVRPETPAPEAPPPQPEFASEYQYSSYNCHCCGAAFYRAVKDEGPIEWTPERIKQVWIDSGSQRQYEYWQKYVDNAYGLGNKDYYRKLQTQYSLEVFTSKKNYLNTHKRGVVPAGSVVSNGITMCPDPIKKHTVISPGGIYVRKEYEPANSRTDDVFEVAPKPIIPEKYRRQSVYETGGGFAFPDDTSVVLLGVVYPGRYAGVSLLRGAQALKAPVGCRVLAIFNQDQRNASGKITPQAIADAGFHEVIRTGNSNHPGSSTLYLYERVIQEGDYDAL